MTKIHTPTDTNKGSLEMFEKSFEDFWLSIMAENPCHEVVLNLWGDAEELVKTKLGLDEDSPLFSSAVGQKHRLLAFEAFKSGEIFKYINTPSF